MRIVKLYQDNTQVEKSYSLSSFRVDKGGLVTPPLGKSNAFALGTICPVACPVHKPAYNKDSCKDILIKIYGLILKSL